MRRERANCPPFQKGEAMIYREFDQLLENIIQKEKEIGKSKGLEYTQGGDRLDNFKRIGKEITLDPKMVLWVYLKKHLDAITFFVRNGEVFSEDILGRILDARVYLSLLWGLIEEERGSMQGVGHNFNLSEVDEVILEEGDGENTPGD